jgi:putative ABC transport system permease protein
MTRGIKSLAGPYVFCSVTTAKALLKNHHPGQVTYVLGKCKEGADPRAVADKLQAMYTDPEAEAQPRSWLARQWDRWFPGENNERKSVSVFTASEFSYRSRMHWLTKTKAGIALGYAAALGLLVGAVVTSQTLYAATAASLREFAVLRALGVPRWRMAVLVMSQAFWIGVIGICLALPVVFALQHLAERLAVSVNLEWWLLCGTAAVTLVMALGSGLAALRSLREVEPATLLR